MVKTLAFGKIVGLISCKVAVSLLWLSLLLKGANTTVWIWERRPISAPLLPKIAVKCVKVCRRANISCGHIEVLHLLFSRSSLNILVLSSAFPTIFWFL